MLSEFLLRILLLENFSQSRGKERIQGKKKGNEYWINYRTKAGAPLELHDRHECNYY